MKIEINKPEIVFTYFGLDEHSVYLIKVKTRANNLEHKAILFTGFKNGNYCVVYNNGYECPIPMMNVYYMKVIKKLTKLE